MSSIRKAKKAFKLKESGERLSSRQRVLAFHYFIMGLNLSYWNKVRYTLESWT